jgi:glycine/serine hydroxymethyltransferase
MGVKEMRQIAGLIYEALSHVNDDSKLASIVEGVRELSQRFPLYKHRLVGE